MQIRGLVLQENKQKILQLQISNSANFLLYKQSYIGYNLT